MASFRRREQAAGTFGRTVALARLKEEAEFLEKRSRLQNRAAPTKRSEQAEREDPADPEPKAARWRLAAAPSSPPGAAAPSLRVPSLVNSFPRLCLQAGGPFASFLRSSFCTTADDCQPAPYTWPCPNPYPEAFRTVASSASFWKKKLVALSVMQLSFLHLGRPTVCPTALRSGVPLNARQWKAVRNLEHLVFGSFFPLSFEAADYGRVGQKLEDQARALDAKPSRAMFLLGTRSRLRLISRVPPV